MLDPNHKHTFATANEVRQGRARRGAHVPLLLKTDDDVCLGCERTRAEVEHDTPRVTHHRTIHARALELGSAIVTYETKAECADADGIITVKGHSISPKQARELAVLLLTAANEAER